MHVKVPKSCPTLCYSDELEPDNDEQAIIELNEAVDKFMKNS